MCGHNGTKDPGEARALKEFSDIRGVSSSKFKVGLGNDFAGSLVGNLVLDLGDQVSTASSTPRSFLW